MPHGDGTISARRREQARRHTSRRHICGFCGKELRGNGGYGSHMRAEYLKRMPELAYLELKALRRAWRTDHRYEVR